MQEKGTETLLDYLKLLFNGSSAFSIAIIIVLIISLIIYLYTYHVYKPAVLEHNNKQRESELKNAQILALFADRNPYPVLRVSGEGKIVASNKSAKEIFNLNDDSEIPLNKILCIENIDHQKAIEQDDSHKFTKSIGEKVFEIEYLGISDLGFAQIYFYDITEREEYSAQVAEYQKKVTALVYELENQLEVERDRISKDLHDSICQTLTVANMHIRKYENEETAVLNQEELKHIEGLISKSVKEIRNVINDFKPIDLKNLGLEQAIKSLIQEKTKGLEITGTSSFFNLPQKLDEKKEICLFRVAQESTANIIKHSEAKIFSIDISCEDNEICMIISDDGKGFETKQLKNGKYVSNGNGLVNIQERVNFAGGELEIDTSPNNGATFIITLPLIS